MNTSVMYGAVNSGYVHRSHCCKMMMSAHRSSGTPSCANLTDRSNYWRILDYKMNAILKIIKSDD